MTKNDLLLLAILAIGACWINWNVIKNSFFHRSSTSLTHSKKNATYISPNKKEVSEEQLL